jgi:Ribbon-helix-helix protein, copG family
MRINARLDEATEKQLEYITQTTGQSVSHVVRESVAQYYAQVRRGQPPSRFLAMAMSGQWRSGYTDTASNVKAVVAEALDAKFPRLSARAAPRAKP